MRVAVVLAVLLSACQFKFERPLKSGEVRGRLVYLAPGSGAETPAAGARVKLVGTTLGTVAETDGTFVFRDVPIGTHTLHATFTLPDAGDEKVQALVPGIAIRARASGTGRSERNGMDLGKLVLNALSVVGGEVTKNGAVVVGAQVVANGYAVAVTGNDGRYAMRLPAGEFDLVAVYPDAPAQRATASVPLRVRQDTTVNFALTANDVAAGSIAGVALYAETEEGLDHSGIRVGLLPAGGGAAIDLVETTPDGIFAAADVPAGVYTLKASATGFRDAHLAPVAVFAGSQTLQVVLSPLPQDPATDDCDRDGAVDAEDPDDDGDGFADGEEAAPCVCAPGELSTDGNENGICDSDEARIPASTTGPDTTPPQIASVTPAADAKGAARNTAVRAVFNEPMNASTLNAATFEVAIGFDPIAGAVTYSGTTGTFTPDRPLNPGTRYTATIAAGTTGAKDVAGNALAAELRWKFTTLGDIAQISAGEYHSCAVRDNGTLFCWGYGQFGQVGDGTTTITINAPVQVGADSDWAQVSAGWEHTCAVKTGHTLWCWGRNLNSALGDGGFTDSLIPKRVGADADWAQVSAGYAHTCALKTGGAIHCWGVNFAGQLGVGDRTSRGTPTAVLGDNTGYRMVSCTGEDHCCALKTDDTLFCWGDGASYQLGDGTATSYWVPTAMGTRKFKTVGAGDYFTCGLAFDDTLWCWGENGNGEAGGDSNTATVQQQTQLGSATYTALGVGVYHSCAVGSGGTLFCWGDNWSGQLGNGTLEYPYALVQAGADADWLTVASGEAHTCALKTDKTLFCFGYNSDGELGNALGGDAVRPVRAGEESDWASLAAGNAHACGLKNDGSLWCWGDNYRGQLGEGTTVQSASPLRVGLDTDWSGLTSLLDLTCALKGAGPGRPLYCWGAATVDFAEQHAPTLFGAATDWAQAARSSHTCAVNTSGELYCIGKNQWGQVGNGATADVTSAMFKHAGTSWASVVAGELHTCALTTTGDRWCWGYEGQGRLGNNASALVARPTPVMLDGGWSSLHVGRAATCGIKSADKSLQCWGAAQLGVGDTLQRTVPTAVSGGGQWLTASIGGLIQQSCGIQTDGSLWCWGPNGSGQLGNGTTADSTVPVRVGTDTDWTHVVSGSKFNCARKQEGSLWCWGTNDSGERANGGGWAVRPLLTPMPPAECQEDGNEPDDTAAAAKAITFQTDWFSFRGAASGRLCTQEDDWRSLSAPAGSVIAAQIANESSGGPLDYRVRGAPDGTAEIGAQTVGPNASARVLTATTASGTQYLKFAPGSAAAGQYSVAVSLYTPANCPDDFPIDFVSAPITDNDTPATAMVAYPTQRGIVYKQMAACPGDADWYRYNQFANTALEFRLWYRPDVADILVEAFDSTATAALTVNLASSTDGSDPNTPTRVYTVAATTADRDIYIKVTRASGPAPWVEYRAYSIR